MTKPKIVEFGILFRFLTCDPIPIKNWLLIAFLTEYSVIDRIIRHLKLTFVAEKPPPTHVFGQVALMAAEEGGEYE